MIKSSEQPPIKPNKGSLLEGLGNTDTDPAVLAREISVDEGWLSKLKALAGGIENFKQWDFSLMFKDTGQDGEYIAAAYLEKEGYKILARNFHTRQGELDIVCQFNEELVFVEVKTRHNDKYGGEKKKNFIGGPVLFTAGFIFRAVALWLYWYYNGW